VAQDPEPVGLPGDAVARALCRLHRQLPLLERETMHICLEEEKGGCHHERILQKERVLVSRSNQEQQKEAGSE
jgi:hypothetical protein